MSVATGDVQAALDRIAVTSAQRWSLIGAGFAAAVGASVVAAVASGTAVGVVTVLVALVAGVAVARPDTHAALVTMGLVAVQWLALVDDTTTPWALVVALCLFVFHVAVAATAVTPITTTIDPVTTRRWITRSAAGGAATGGVWVIAVWLADRQAPGNTMVTAGALAVLAVLALVARHRLRAA